MDHEEKLAAQALSSTPASGSVGSRVGGRASVSSDTEVSSEAVSSKVGTPSKAVAKKKPNTVRKDRIERMMSKAELARRANLSVLTIDRVEKGFGCRMDTKRKILEALGLSLADRVRVFGEEE
jgi:ribosome-binding protein aMBF1 (putative translation factor)